MTNFAYFIKDNFFDSSIKFFKDFQIHINTSINALIHINDLILEEKYRKSDDIKLINNLYFLGMVDDSVLSSKSAINFEKAKSIEEDYDGLVFMSIELNERKCGLLPTKSQLANISRIINRSFKYTPTIILFKYSNLLALTHTQRENYKRMSIEGERPGKVTILKDINTENTHQGHIRILDKFQSKDEIKTYKDLYTHISNVFSVKLLNRDFYNDLFSWFQLAVKTVKFPEVDKDNVKDKAENNNETNVIRLITRILFAWFIKEKNLVPNEFFNKGEIDKIITYGDDKSSNYYKAILQNLFFGTLNQEIKKRDFRKEGQNRSVFNLYRYESLFQDKNRFKALAEKVPFLNGGLFECLDYESETVTNKGGGKKVIRVDCFTDNENENTLSIPNSLFFSDNGLINIFNGYKFTVTENTPMEQEIALDPELLGKVFENLLGAYNPETRDNVRKSTGSFYTPREVVDYMVDESLKEYFRSKLPAKEAGNIIENLFSFSESIDIPKPLRKDIIDAVDNCKVLDPACGSGAFPMGVLHRLVDILHKVDPSNSEWKERQLAHIEDSSLKEDIEKSFNDNDLNYGRKLYLIKKCIYGVDIQPIAVQIAKLRFFISLVVDQNATEDMNTNYGIRALPNLETKFVAADSLLSENLPVATDEILAIISKLDEIRDKFYSARTRDTKNKYKNADNLLRRELSEKLAEQPMGTDSTIICKIANWSPYTTDKAADFFSPKIMFGLDTGFNIIIGNPPYIQMQKIKKEKYGKSNFKTYASTGDIYQLFIESSYSLLSLNGCVAFITSNKWLRAGYGESTRAFLSSMTLKLLDLGGGVFVSATVDVAITIFKKLTNEKIINICYKSKDPGRTTKAFSAITFKGEIAELNQLKEKDLLKITPPKDNTAWIIQDDISLSILNKIKAKGKPLKDWDVKIYRGVLTGLNEAFIISTEKKDEILKNCADKKERERTAAIIHPILRGKDIKRYSYEWKDLWIIGTFPSLQLNIEDFPSLKKYLLAFGDSIKQIGKVGTRKKTSNEWFETQDSIAYWDEFLKPKIVYSEIVQAPQFAFDKNGYYPEATTFFMTGEYIELILGYLNSSIGYYIFKVFYAGGGLGNRGIRYKKAFLENIPIPIILAKDLKYIKQQIERLNINHDNEYRAAIVNKINEFFYNYYNLSDQERDNIVKETIE